MTREEFEKLRDEASDSGKWLGGSHGRYLRDAWVNGADFAWPIIERQEKELQAYRALMPKLREALRHYSKEEIEARFKDCWTNEWTLTPSIQYGSYYLLNEDGQIIFSFTRLIEALALLDEVEKV